MPVLQDKPKEIIPAGTHTAICYGCVDLGTQLDEVYNKTSRKFIWLFETPDELMESGKPFAHNETYTLTKGDKAKLTKHYMSWEGKEQQSGFDPASQVGKACNITIVHNQVKDKTYANCSAITPLKKGEKAPPQHNASLVFDLDDYNEAVFENLPKWMKDKIALSPEFATPKRKAQNPHTRTANAQENPIEEYEGEQVPF